MTELYFKMRLIGFSIIVSVCILIFLFVFIKILVASFKEKRIEKYLTSIGYKRELISVASVGTNHTYGYKRYTNNVLSDIIRDYELKNMSIKQIKKKYK